MRHAPAMAELQVAPDNLGSLRRRFRALLTVEEIHQREVVAQCGLFSKIIDSKSMAKTIDVDGKKSALYLGHHLSHHQHAWL